MVNHREWDQVDRREENRQTDAVSNFNINFDSVERQQGVKTKFCPDVAGFCPRVSWILSWSGRGVSWFALNIGGRTFRIGSECSGGNRVKRGGGSGGCGALVATVPVGVDPPRARARGEVAYDSGGVDQGESVQRGVREVQWGGLRCETIVNGNEWRVARRADTWVRTLVSALDCLQYFVLIDKQSQCFPPLKAGSIGGECQIVPHPGPRDRFVAGSPLASLMP